MEDGKPFQAEKPLEVEKPLKVLVFGSGGREHALLQAVARSARCGEVMAAPGNGGMAREARCLPVDVGDVTAMVGLAQAEGVDFVVVGPEQPLAAGVVDALEAAGIKAFGPRQAGAQLEASKAFSKDFMARHGIPTAAYAAFPEVTAMEAWLAAQAEGPLVVKASGLAAGKGVIMCASKAEAAEAGRKMLTEGQFGASGQVIVIEEFLEGEEASLMLVVSGQEVVALPVSQDHKRAGEGDTGLNTGGMGAYAPAAVFTPEIEARTQEVIIQPILRGLAAEGMDYRGVLYVGLMLTASGPKVLEFNCRFGDPECQVLLPLLESDPLELMLACAEGRLGEYQPVIREGAAMIVVLASAGYPGSYPKGEVISLPEPLPEGVQIIHAGTKLDEAGTLRTSGGRVLGVTAVAETLEEAARRAYETAAGVEFASKYLRRDIGWRQLKREGG